MSNPGKARESTDVRFDRELITRYGGRGPRYTSYPTALQFDDALDDRFFREAVEASNASDRDLSLYVHIPFCESLCYYCGCNKIVTRNQPRIERYLNALACEISHQGTLFDDNRPVTQLHFGGGTPTYLTDKQLTNVMALLGDTFWLQTDREHEFSIEIDPRSTHDETMELLASLGFNRASLGIQDFDPRVQIAVNRIQSEEDVQRLVDDARQLNFRSLSFDLIYGLPHQDVTTFDKTLDTVIRMQPDRLAVYNYAHLPERFKGQRMIKDQELPSPEVKLEILQHTIEKLLAAGYVYIGMDHFALPDDDLAVAKRAGTLQRNFQGYSTYGGSDLLSLGVSAISNLSNTFAQNVVHTAKYEEIVAEGRLPLYKGLVVDEDDQIRGRVIHEIMCHDGLDIAEFSAAEQIDFASYFFRELDALRALQVDGLVEVDDRRITVTPTGRLLMRSIAMVFDRHLTTHSDQRFSKAI